MTFIPLFAQAASGAIDMFGVIMPMIGIFAVFYFFMIRPQQKKQREHQEFLNKVERGDTVVTHGGLIGKVTRVTDDSELLVEVGKGVEVRIVRGGIADIRGKTPAPKAETKKAKA